MSHPLLNAVCSALNLPGVEVDFTGEGELPSYFAVTDLAAASVGAAALAVRQLMVAQGSAASRVQVDRRLASMWFSWSFHPVGWERPPLWDAIAGDYATADGWIRLHTNAPHHRDAVLAALGCVPERSVVARAVAAWRGLELEEAVLAQGGCAAVMRSMEEWRAHPQGRSVASEPLIALADTGRASQREWAWSSQRPLAGLRVLDLTRVLAGPVATRFLAGYGADVLRIDPPCWNEPGVIPEVTLGKRCARLDLRRPEDRAVFEKLLAQADVLVHGYRPAALERLGYGESMRRQLNPALIDVALNAYGWNGPQAGRRGFDSLVQMSSGIAHYGMRQQGAGQPVPLPVQALDHATGYLMAAAVVRALSSRLTEGRAMQARLSLARTAKLLTDAPPPSVNTPFAPTRDDDFSPQLEQTEWGPARRYRPPAIIDGAPMQWDLPASSLGGAKVNWLLCNSDKAVLTSGD
ncbi:CoA-transferase family III [Duganella sp. CF402]|uniref:CoA transferase n=1 Tax=unclassified Duganella TaxID=2636909 RepID=UPI0008CAB44D|nr:MULTISPECIES: CoA transferase [unclassified Duganella]RZT11152.1 CoA transferase family III [Duganella sp. BK701]SEK78977.1 CoA-transferase family III [Duganella sp. CF402]